MAGRKSGGRKVDATGRSKGDGRFVRLTFEMLNSAAYRSLSPNARALLVEFAMLFNGSNNRRIGFTSRQGAPAMGVGNLRTFASARDELINRNFIIQTSPVSNSSYAVRRAPEYRLTWLPTGEPAAPIAPTNDYRRWSREQVFPMADRHHADGQSPSHTESLLAEDAGGDGRTPSRNCSSPQLSVVPSDGDTASLIVYHRGAPARANVPECDAARKLSWAWIEKAGRGGQRQLARRSGLSESKLCKFLNPRGCGRTLRKEELDGLRAALRGPLIAVAAE